MKKSVWMRYLILGIVMAITIGPFIWMILTSFKTFEEAIRVPVTILPQMPTTEAYVHVWERFPFMSFYVNTFATLFFTIVIQLMICSMAAYAFARLRFPGRDVIFIVLLALLMVPGQVFLLPNFLTIVRMDLADTVTALWLPRVFSAFGTFMLREFFKGIPKSLDEAAKLDGCSFFKIYLFVLLPLLKPALASLAILTAIATFRDLMWPLIVNRSLNMMTLSAGLAMLIGEHQTHFPQVMAGGVMAMTPMLILFFIFQKQIIQGIATTGVKQ